MAVASLRAFVRGRSSSWDQMIGCEFRRAGLDLLVEHHGDMRRPPRSTGETISCSPCRTSSQLLDLICRRDRFLHRLNPQLPDGFGTLGLLAGDSTARSQGHLSTRARPHGRSQLKARHSIAGTCSAASRSTICCRRGTLASSKPWTATTGGRASSSRPICDRWIRQQVGRFVDDEQDHPHSGPRIRKTQRA